MPNIPLAKQTISPSLHKAKIFYSYLIAILVLVNLVNTFHYDTYLQESNSYEFRKQYTYLFDEKM